MSKAKVAIVMGSERDWGVMERCAQQLGRLGIAAHVEIMSTHRSPERVQRFAESARDEGFEVIIAAAGMSAALAGIVAAHTALPVIGVPLAAGALQGIDALLSTVQMPAGVPVASVGIGESGATNAAILAARIIAAKDEGVAQALDEHRAYLARNVAARNRALQERLRAGAGEARRAEEEPAPGAASAKPAPDRDEAPPRRPERLKGAMSVSVGHSAGEMGGVDSDDATDLERLAELASQMSEDDIKALQALARKLQDGKED